MTSHARFIGLFVSLALAALLFSGCMSRGYELTYQPEFPDTLPKTADPMIFSYYDVNIERIHKMFFKDLLLIGRSSFTGPYNDPVQLKKFAAEQGAHVVVTSASLAEQRTHQMTYEMPVTPQISVVGGNDTGPAGAHTTAATSTQRMNMTVSIFDQNALFFRRDSGAAPFWEMNLSQFRETERHPLAGCWSGPGGEVLVFLDTDQVLGFAVEGKESPVYWEPGDLKFVFPASEKGGVFLLEDKTPHMAQYTLDDAGRMVVRLPIAGETAVFERSAACGK